MAPAEFDPRDIVTDEDAEEDGAGDVGGAEDEGCGACSAADDDGDDRAGKSGERKEGFEEGAVGVATDAAVGGLKELLKLPEED